MKLVTVILASMLVAAESARLGGYSLPGPDTTFNHGSSSGSFSTSHSTGGSFGTSGHFDGGSFSSSDFGFGGSCSGGQVRHVDGRCVTPEVQRKVYVYNIPQQSRPTGPRPHVPLPKVEHNILFVRLPENAGSPDPIVVPPPQQKNIVYVLSKGGADGGQKVINVPAPAKTQPEVYFVDYDDGENPTLPGGVDLQSALSSASHQGVGQVIGGGGSSGGGFIGGGSVGGISGGISGSGFTGGISGSSFTGGISGSGFTGGISGGDHSGGHGIISEPSGLYTTP